ncbi:MAG: GxxExxY protein [Ignavibacteria bacterium]|nr:GxxExxY protein [Ignavibacteria bacterium]
MSEENQILISDVDEGNIAYQDLTYKIIGMCMEVHRSLGRGLLEVLYKDALEHELRLANVKFEREKNYNVIYKGMLLKHQFCADFVVDEKVILEIKSCNHIVDEFIKQTLNYMGISQCKVGLLINFGEPSLNFKRLIL